MSTNLESGRPVIEKQRFGSLPDGRKVDIFTLSNSRGMRVRISDYGGKITECHVPDKNGKFENVVLGFDNLPQYLEFHPYFGSLIGRYANRIANAEFELEDKAYKLAANNGVNTLHGGTVGFDQKIWDATTGTDTGAVWLRLHYLSSDMEEGFPGNLDVTVTYILDETNSLVIRYEAFTDKATPINLTNHSYFNLRGAGNGNVLDHVAQMRVSSFTPVDETLIPTGELKSVEGTPFDFRNPRRIGDCLTTMPGAYDHNLIFEQRNAEFDPAGTVQDPESGRKLTFYTDQPAMQLYTGDVLKGDIKGLGGVYERFGGLCLETQHFPDSVHHQAFPSVILRPGEKFRSFTRFQFTA